MNVDGTSGPQAAHRRRRRRPGAMQITDRDRALLGFVAEHRLVLAEHVQALLGVSASVVDTRLRALTTAELLARRPVFHRQPACFQITGRGLAAVDSQLPRPRLDLRCYKHDIGLAWLWLGARAGAFGQLRKVISERQLRSRDATVDGQAEPSAVRLGGYGPGGRERLHYPDLLLVTADGHRVAVELELTGKGRVRREKILAGYGADARIEAVVYFVDRAALGRAVASSASKLGISSLVHVQPFVQGASMRGLEPGAQAHRIRAAGRNGRAGSPAERGQ